MIKRQRSYSGERDRKIQLRKGEAEDGSYEKMEDSFDDGNDLKEFLPEDLYQCLEEENRFLEAGDAINGRVPVAIGIFDTDLKKDCQATVRFWPWGGRRPIRMRSSKCFDTSSWTKTIRRKSEKKA